MKVAVTGARGFVGRHVLAALSQCQRSNSRDDTIGRRSMTLRP